MTAIITSTHMLATVSATLQQSRKGGASFAARLNEAQDQAAAAAHKADIRESARSAREVPAPADAGANPQLREKAVARAAQDIVGAAQRTSALLRALMPATAPSATAPRLTSAVPMFRGSEIGEGLLSAALPLSPQQRADLSGKRDQLLSDLQEIGSTAAAITASPAAASLPASTASSGIDSENLLVYLLMGRFCPPSPRGDPPRRRLLKRQEDKKQREDGEDSAWDNDFCMQSILGKSREEKPSPDDRESAA